MSKEIKVFVKINGQTAAFFVGTTCPYEARNRVIEHLREKKIEYSVVMAVVK